MNFSFFSEQNLCSQNDLPVSEYSLSKADSDAFRKGRNFMKLTFLSRIHCRVIRETAVLGGTRKEHMEQRSLKKLSRLELVDLLIEQTRRNVDLSNENQQLREQLNQRNLICSQAGSIAQASLEISGIFQAAQEAADLYLESIRAQSCSANNREAFSSQCEPHSDPDTLTGNENDLISDSPESGKNDEEQ